MSSSQPSLSLANFFIFNSSFGPREGEEEKKILYYHPTGTHLDTRIKDVGLCEAIIKFTNTFSAVENTCKVFRTQKTVQFLNQAETGYWMVMSIKAPLERKSDGADGADYIEYKGDQVHEKIYGNLLKQAYHFFRMYSNTFESNAKELTDGVPKHLMAKLDEFYTKYISTLKLNRCDILTVFRSLHYVPLEQALFLRVHNFIQRIKSGFPAIRHCLLMHDEQMVWSEINPTDMYSVFEYLVNVILPKTLKNSRSHSNGDVGSDSGVFVTGPAKFIDCTAVPTVHIFNGDNCERLHLVLYKIGLSVLGMFFDESASLTDATYHDLHTTFRLQLSSIGSAITESQSRSALTELSLSTSTTTNSPSGPRFLFLNELNLKHTGTLHINPSRSAQSSKAQVAIPNEVMNLLADLFNEATVADASIDPVAEETVVKTLNDYWIVRRSSNWRHFFVVVNKSSTLLSVTEEARAIFDEHAKKVFFDK